MGYVYKAKDSDKGNRGRAIKNEIQYVESIECDHPKRKKTIRQYKWLDSHPKYLGTEV